MATTLPPSRFFPPAQYASEEGLLMVGGRLSPEWLLDAYRHGIFPWPVLDEGEPMLWWSPDPRAVLPLDGLRVPRRLARTCRSGRFQVTCDLVFEQVIEACAGAQDRHESSWLTGEMIAAYVELYRLGYAHSVETWWQGELAGGLYGVALGGLFAAESMFYRLRDASKVALVRLVAHLRNRGYQLLDIQQLSNHTARLGAVEIPRGDYLRQLAAALAAEVTFGTALEGPVESASSGGSTAGAQPPGRQNNRK